uniref:TIL domain-containing protein n=1 Tax=Steinernema glaseri TaxID=37863 RepID=A0A1I7YTT3_9BILA
MKLIFFFFVVCCTVCVADKLTDFPGKSVLKDSPLVVLTYSPVSSRLYPYFLLIFTDDPRCGKNEMWTRCGCESTCGVDRPCYGMCGSPRCQCKYGHSRNPDTGICVHFKECPGYKAETSV